MELGVSVAGILVILLGLFVFVMVIAALVIAIVALARASKNAREINNLKSGGTTAG